MKLFTKKEVTNYQIIISGLVSIFYFGQMQNFAICILEELWNRALIYGLALSIAPIILIMCEMYATAFVTLLVTSFFTFWSLSMAKAVIAITALGEWTRNGDIYQAGEIMKIKLADSINIWGHWQDYLPIVIIVGIGLIVTINERRENQRFSTN